MRESMPGLEPEEPSAEHAAIAMADVLRHLARLRVKMAEHQTDAASREAAKTSLRTQLQRSVLEVLVDMAIEEPNRSTIYLHEVALAVQDRTGLSVVRAATVPFIPRPDGPGHEPDFARLLAETGPADVAFSEAYMTIRGYCDGTFPMGVEP
jgi:hypothetical protein